MRKALTVIAASIAALSAVPATAIASSTRAADDSAAHASGSGSVVVDWDRSLLSIVRTKGAQPATVHATRSFAILSAAIYDAVASITHDAKPYRTVPVSSDARPDAAAAEAGHDALVALYPNFQQSLDQLLATQLAVIPASTDKQQGIQVGHAAAIDILALRAHDGSDAVAPPFVAGTQPGDYRPTPPNFPAPVFTHWAKVTPFLLHDADQFRPEPPPSLTSDAYADAINEVKALGQSSSAVRAPDQTVVANFWAAPIWNYWNEIAQNAALAHRTDLVRTSALFLDLNLSFADSAIAFYDAKYTFQLWRPVSAIQLADTAGNPDVVGDPNWLPLATTPADPSYPGAHSVISAAGAEVLSAFFGDRDSISVTSEVLPGVVRTFDGYRDAATEAGLSRIFAGLHTRLDHVAGLKLGHEVAEFVLDRMPVPDED